MVVPTVAIDPGPEWPPLHRGALLLVAYMAIMMAVSLLASIVPLRRALAVEPTEALASDG